MKFSAAVAIVVVLVGGSAQADAKHTWYNINYATGKCVLSEMSPQKFHNLMNSPMGHMYGMALEPIAPEDVTKEDNGAIHVHMTGTHNGEAVMMDFFNSLAPCSKYVSDNNIVPQQANEGDIN